MTDEYAAASVPTASGNANARTAPVPRIRSSTGAASDSAAISSVRPSVVPTAISAISARGSFVRPGLRALSRTRSNSSAEPPSDPSATASSAAANGTSTLNAQRNRTVSAAAIRPSWTSAISDAAPAARPNRNARYTSAHSAAIPSAFSAFPIKAPPAEA